VSDRYGLDLDQLMTELDEVARTSNPSKANWLDP
jgi:hypothetical protein